MIGRWLCRHGFHRYRLYSGDGKEKCKRKDCEVVIGGG